MPWFDEGTPAAGLARGFTKRKPISLFAATPRASVSTSSFEVLFHKHLGAVHVHLKPVEPSEPAYQGEKSFGFGGVSGWVVGCVIGHFYYLFLLRLENNYCFRL